MAATMRCADRLEALQVLRGHVLAVAGIGQRLARPAWPGSVKRFVGIRGLRRRVTPRVEDELGVGVDVHEAVDAVRVEHVPDVPRLGLGERRRAARTSSAQGRHDVWPSVTPHSRSTLRLRSTPSHDVPGLSRLFLRHMSSTVITWWRPSGLHAGKRARGRASRASPGRPVPATPARRARGPCRSRWLTTRSTASSTSTSGFISSRACAPPTSSTPRRSSPVPARSRRA